VSPSPSPGLSIFFPPSFFQRCVGGCFFFFSFFLCATGVSAPPLLSGFLFFESCFPFIPPDAPLVCARMIWLSSLFYCVPRVRLRTIFFSTHPPLFSPHHTPPPSVSPLGASTNVPTALAYPCSIFLHYDPFFLRDEMLSWP